MRLRPQHGLQILRHLGPGWLFYRARRACRLKFGSLRRQLPASEWSAQPLVRFLTDPRQAAPERYATHRHDSAPPFLFSPAAQPQFQPRLVAWDQLTTTLSDHSGTRVAGNFTPPVPIADDIATGHLRFFEHHRIATGFPPDWHRNPLSGERLPADQHWTRIGDFPRGDIKLIWEPSRFAFAYALVRAYWRTGNELYPELFWQLLESWRHANPPHCGPNWKCGQEAAIRVLAWCFSIYGLSSSRHTTAERIAQAAQMIAVSATRIESDLEYAISQRNNHGISEAAGLWTVGLLFPEFRASGRWLQLGGRWLEQQARELIAGDGSFSQHSFNYQRVMLDVYLWCDILGAAQGRRLSAETRERIGAAGELLFQVQDESSGQLPRYGQNDGALILPLTNCDHQDYRPMVQAVGYWRDGTRQFDSGPWDEGLLWLFGPTALDARRATVPRQDLVARQGGYYTFRTEAGFAFTRACRFRHRPGQADQLHVDIWWRGLNIACDPGTYSYNAPPPWDNPLAQTRYHNTVSVDERDQMDRVGRFLWLPWCTGRVHRCESGPNFSFWEAEHDGYRRLPSPATHRRTLIRLGVEHWLVLDEIASRDPHRVRLHWLLADVPYEPLDEPSDAAPQHAGGWMLQTRAGAYAVRWGSSAACDAGIVRASAATADGWYAPYYAAREPALAAAIATAAAAVRFWTLLGPPTYQLQSGTEAWELQLPTCRVAFTARDGIPLGDLLEELRSL